MAKSLGSGLRLGLTNLWFWFYVIGLGVIGFEVQGFGSRVWELGFGV